MAGRRPIAPRPQGSVQLPAVADPSMQRALDVLSSAIADLQARNHAPVISGAGSPEGVVAAAVGTLYLRSDGGAGSTLYVKESGTDVTGWAAK